MEEIIEKIIEKAKNGEFNDALKIWENSGKDKYVIFLNVVGKIDKEIEQQKNLEIFKKMMVEEIRKQLPFQW